MPRADSRTKRDRVRRELRDLVLRAGMAGGGILGLLWMLNTMPVTTSASACKGVNVEIGKCASDTLMELFVPGLAKFGVGVFGGAFLAVVLIGVIPGLRRRPVTEPERGR